jgi:hypothetical protein
MRAVAKRAVFRIFAAAEIGGLAGLGGEFGGHKAAAFMAAIAEGLRFGLATRAPEIGLSGLYFDGKGGFLRNIWHVGHLASFGFGGDFARLWRKAAALGHFLLCKFAQRVA